MDNPNDRVDLRVAVVDPNLYGTRPVGGIREGCGV